MDTAVALRDDAEARMLATLAGKFMKHMAAVDADRRVPRAVLATTVRLLAAVTLLSPEGVPGGVEVLIAREGPPCVVVILPVPSVRLQLGSVGGLVVRTARGAAAAGGGGGDAALEVYEAPRGELGALLRAALASVAAGLAAAPLAPFRLAASDAPPLAPHAADLLRRWTHAA